MINCINLKLAKSTLWNYYTQKLVQSSVPSRGSIACMQSLLDFLNHAVAIYQLYYISLPSWHSETNIYTEVSAIPIAV